MQRILVLNPKGGSGKTTIATNLASYFASQGDHPLLSDEDPQGSSTRWLKKRKPEQAFIHGIAAFDRNSRMTRAWQMRVPADAAHVVARQKIRILIGFAIARARDDGLDLRRRIGIFRARFWPLFG